DFLRQAGCGLGTIALASLLAEEGRTADSAPEMNPFGPKRPHFPAKAKNVIFLYMEGAPSQLDLFDPKPELQKWHGRPLPDSLTPWAQYGRGSESKNLPGFVVLSTGKSNMSQSAQWSSGFLPSAYQGVMFRRKGDPVLYLSNPAGVTPEEQRADLDLVSELNRERYAATGDAEINSRISSYEMAFRMQTSTPE